MSEIFLSYRRQDSASATGRLSDRLGDHFGEARVFHDHASILAGEDFADEIRRAIGSAIVVLVVIGPDWVAAVHPDGRRRLEDPADFVRLEIEAALAAGIGLVPVLVEGAVMPDARQLPASLHDFARCQAVELSTTRWRYDTDRLIEMLQSRFAIESERPPLGASAGGFGSAARIALDLLDLATHPTRLIARRQTGRAIDHLRAFAFLVTSLLIGNAALLIGTNLHPTPSSVGGAVGGILGWMLSGVLIGLLLVTLLAVPLTLAWRFAGSRVEFRQVTLILAYVYGGAWLGLCAGAMLLGFGMQLVDATVFDRAVELLAGRAAGAPRSVAERWRLAQDVLVAGLGGPTPTLLVLSTLTWLIAAVWTVVAWGAFRLAFGVGRARAALATSLFAAMLGVVALVAYLLT